MLKLLKFLVQSEKSGKSTHFGVSQVALSNSGHSTLTNSTHFTSLRLTLS